MKNQILSTIKYGVIVFCLLMLIYGLILRADDWLITAATTAGVIGVGYFWGYSECRRRIKSDKNDETTIADEENI
jgi:hypothetical protein